MRTKQPKTCGTEGNKILQQLYANKLDNLDKMDKFLETCILPKLSQEE